jgi:ferric-dicitrate binding protein FerR (iron transport regulator)
MKPEDLLAYLDRELAPEQEEALERALERDPVLRQALLAACWQRLLLLDLHRPRTLTAMPSAVAKRRQQIRRWSLALAATVAFIASLAAWWLAADRLEPGEPISSRLVVEGVTPPVWRLRGERKDLLQPGTILVAGDTILTGKDATAKLSFEPEATHLDLASESELHLAALTHGKRLELRSGSLQAQVAPQPPGEPMRLLTPLAQAEVIGTRFGLSSDAVATRLRVDEGRVLISKRSEDSGLVVPAPLGATVSAGHQVDMVTLPLGESVERGLIFDVPFDDGAGFVARDRSVSHADAHIRTSDTQPPPWTRGWSGSALDFRNSGVAVNTPVIDLPRQFTISLWALVDSGATELQPLIANSASGVNTDGFRLFINADARRVFFETGSARGLGAQACSEPDVLAPGAWHHIVVAGNCTTGTMIFYVDGRDVTAHPGIRSDFARQQPLHIGRMATDFRRRFGGLIDEVRIYSRELSGAEVAELARRPAGDAAR